MNANHPAPLVKYLNSRLCMTKDANEHQIVIYEVNGYYYAQVYRKHPTAAFEIHPWYVTELHEHMEGAITDASQEITNAAQLRTPHAAPVNLSKERIKPMTTHVITPVVRHASPKEIARRARELRFSTRTQLANLAKRLNPCIDTAGKSKEDLITALLEIQYPPADLAAYYASPED